MFVMACSQQRLRPACTSVMSCQVVLSALRITKASTTRDLGWQHSFVEIDHEIFSTVILSLPLIQEGQLSVSGEECAQYWLTA